VTPKITRRRLLGGGAAALAIGGAGFLEAQSFDGRYDHRSWPGASGADRFARSRAALAGSEGDGALVHVGHSTHLISIAHVTFLTDPWFYDPAFGALAHVRGPAVAPEDVGALDVVLVTHDHADHADMRALDRLDKRARAIVATADLASRMRALGFADVAVLPPWEELRVGAASVTAVPALHDVYEIGFVLRGAGRCVYFAGDSRLHPDLPAIAERFSPTAAILPVDGTRIRTGGRHVMTPDDAVSAARTLGVSLAIPSHAEARFSDPLAATFLASTIEGASALFRDRMSRSLPAVGCAVPASGELVPI